MVKKTQKLVSVEQYKEENKNVAVTLPEATVDKENKLEKENEELELKNKKLTIIRRTLANATKSNTEHIKDIETVYGYNESIACNCMVLGATTSGKTSYILAAMLHDKNPRKLVIFINSPLANWDPMVVQFCLENEWTRMIQTSNYDMALATFLNEYIESIDIDQANKISCYIIVDNLFANTDPNALKMLTTNRHRRQKIWFLVHSISSTIARSLSVLRELCTHLVVFKWYDKDKLPLILPKSLIEVHEKEVNGADPKQYKKLIYDKNKQVSVVE